MQLHYTTLQLQLHYATLHYTRLHHTISRHSTQHYNTLHNTTATTTLHYFTLHHTRLHTTIPRYSTQHYSTLHYTTPITPHHNNNCNCTTLIKLHYSYSSTTRHCSYNYNWATPHYIQQLWWGDRCNPCHRSKKHNSNHLLLLVHQWIRSAICDSQQPTSPIGFLFLKLLPPPCAVRLVHRIYSNDGRRGWCPSRPSQQSDGKSCVYICIHSPAVLSPLYFVAVAVQNAQDGMMPRRCDIWAPAPLSCCPGLPGMLGQFWIHSVCMGTPVQPSIFMAENGLMKAVHLIIKGKHRKTTSELTLEGCLLPSWSPICFRRGLSWASGHLKWWHLKGQQGLGQRTWRDVFRDVFRNVFRDVLDVSLSCKDPRGRYTACSAWWLLSETPARLDKRESSVGMEIQKLRQQKENVMRSASKPWRCGMWKPQYGIWATLHNPPGQTHGVYLFSTGQHNKWTCMSTAGSTTFVATRLVPVLIIANFLQFAAISKPKSTKSTKADIRWFPFDPVPSTPHITWRVEDRRIWRILRVSEGFVDSNDALFKIFRHVSSLGSGGGSHPRCCAWSRARGSSHLSHIPSYRLAISVQLRCEFVRLFDKQLHLKFVWTAKKPTIVFGGLSANSQASRFDAS